MERSRRKIAIPFAAFVTVGLIAILNMSMAQTEPPKIRPFATWPKNQKPAAALFISGRQHGYLEPCGCTGLDNQKGGLARRHTLLNMFLKRKWDIAPIDVGNQVRRTGPQAQLKFDTTLNAFRTMKYQAVGIGPDDLKLSNLLGSLADGDLCVCANVDMFGLIPTHKVLKVGKKTIGVTCVLGSDHVKKVANADVTKMAPEKGLAAAIPKLKGARCDYIVVLSFASMNETKALAKKFQDIDLIVTAGGNGEPTLLPEKIPGSKALLIQTGKKGMYVGIIGFYDDPKTPIRYQRLALDKKIGDSKVMLENLKEYQENLKARGLAGLGLKPVPHPSGRTYVGSETCGECHTQAYEHWQKTPHSHATESIVHPVERSDVQRHFDPECLSCHVTGWNPQQYYPYTSGYLELEKSAAMHGNGCENCHGPGSAHVAAENGEVEDLTDDEQNKRRLAMRQTLDQAKTACMDCHDLDNSPDFHLDGAFEKYWKQIAHPWRD